jgi:hypothetical protein
MTPPSFIEHNGAMDIHNHGLMFSLNPAELGCGKATRTWSGDEGGMDGIFDRELDQHCQEQLIEEAAGRIREGQRNISLDV